MMRSAHRCFRFAVVVCVCALSVGLAPSGAVANSDVPTNDDFLFSDNLNTPGTPLNPLTTFEDLRDTVDAGVQQNLFAPCGMGTCRTGPSESTTCRGVNYGNTVWYDFYPDHDGQVEIRTSGIPNVIALYSYGPHTLVPHELQCAPGSSYRFNDLFANVQQGVNYTYQIGGRNGAGGSIEMLFNYADSSHLTVAPFLSAATLVSVTGQPSLRHLVKLRFIGVTPRENIAYASASWRPGIFHRSLKGNIITLRASAPPTVSSRTRFLIAATSPAQIGRFKLYGVNVADARLPVIAQGCLAAGTNSIPAAAAGNLSLLPQVTCPTTPLLNPTGAEYAFWRGRTGRLFEMWYTGGRWSPPLRVSARGLGSSPAVAVHADGEQDVFWRGAKGNLWETWYTGAWNGPIDLGAGDLGSGPSVGVDAAGDEYVFWRGSDGGLWEMSYADRQWSQPVEFDAGRLGSAPAVAVQPNGEQDVFWKGTDGHLWETWYRGAWSGPVDLGAGQLGSGPSVGVDAAGNEYVFWRGSDGGLWEMSYADRQWSQPVEVSAGPLGAAPAVAVQADGEQDVFWTAPNGRLREKWYTGAWNGPINLGAGGLGSAPGVGVNAVGKQSSG
jgi:hypothetical protein